MRFALIRLACCVLPLILSTSCDPGTLPARWHARFNWRAEDYFADPQVIELCRAIEAGDLAQIDRLVAAGADVNARGRGNMTPLLWAFPDNKLARFRRLLELGADPNVIVTSDFGTRGAIQPGDSVTHLASGTTFAGYFREVFAHGGDPNLPRQTQALGQGDTPVFTVIASATADKPEKLRQLIARGADLNRVSGSELTPAMQAVAWGGQYDLALQLLQAGADPAIYAQSRSNQRLVHLALADGAARRPHWSAAQQADHAALLDWLAQHGQSPDQAQADLDRWKSWSISTGEFRRKMDAEIAARQAAPAVGK